MQKIQDLKEKSPKLYLGSSIFLFILVGLMTALPIAMIVIGSKYQNECTIESKIPLWLIVQGSVSILMAILMVLGFITQATLNKTGMILSGFVSCFLLIVALFQFSWFIAGNVWVYSKRPTVVFNDTTSANYCQETLYLFSFWVITVSYILIGVSIFGGICLCLCLGCCTLCCFARAEKN